jgi:hypothetical protein
MRFQITHQTRTTSEAHTWAERARGVAESATRGRNQAYASRVKNKVVEARHREERAPEPKNCVKS